MGHSLFLYKLRFGTLKLAIENHLSGKKVLTGVLKEPGGYEKRDSL